TPVDEQACLFGVPRFAEYPREFGETRFDLRMPTDPVPAAGSELLAHVVRRAACHLGETVRAAGAVPRHRSLEQVPKAVELMARGQVGVATSLTWMAVTGVQIPVLVLRRGDSFDQRVPHGLQHGICRSAHLPGECFEQLVDFRIGELPARPVCSGGTAG